MSFETALFTRDRPIIVETQSSWLKRGGDFAWESEEWLFGDMTVLIEPYAFEAGESDPLGELFSEGEEVPSWTKELRWVVHVSGRHPDDDFFEWFEDLAASARGVIWNPTLDEALEHVAAAEPREVALRMMRATRPAQSEANDRLREIVRPHPSAAARDALIEAATAMLAEIGRNVPELREAATAAYTAKMAEVEAATQEEENQVYGADIEAVRAAGLRLSWDGIQYVVLAADADDGGTMRWSVFDAPVRGKLDARALVEITTHPDPRIDACMRDPARSTELEVLLGDEPADPLLRAIVGPTTAPLAALRDSAALRNELVVFWEQVISLDPRLDPEQFTDDLKRPRMG